MLSHGRKSFGRENGHLHQVMWINCQVIQYAGGDDYGLVWSFSISYNKVAGSLLKFPAPQLIFPQKRVFTRYHFFPVQKQLPEDSSSCWNVEESPMRSWTKSINNLLQAGESRLPWHPGDRLLPWRVSTTHLPPSYHSGPQFLLLQWKRNLPEESQTSPHWGLPRRKYKSLSGIWWRSGNFIRSVC